MAPVARIFRSFEEADQADREYFEKLTPQERLEIFLEILARGRSADESDQRLERVCGVAQLGRS